MRIAIMQPYFLPYAGYFRLFAATDLFVVYDCVQFPRRGWVHRNRFLHASGENRWLTLPLQKAPQSARIDALRFDASRYQEWRDMLLTFPCFASPALADAGLTRQVTRLDEAPINYIEALLKRCCEVLNLPFCVKRSSALHLSHELRGQERILAICRHFGATTYINSPGGQNLYAVDAFRQQGIELRFLTSYQGNMTSIAQRLAIGGIAPLRREISDQLHLIA